MSIPEPSPVAWKIGYLENSLSVQWLRLCASSAGGVGSIADKETKIPHAAQCGQNNKILNNSHKK